MKQQNIISHFLFLSENTDLNNTEELKNVT